MNELIKLKYVGYAIAGLAAFFAPLQGVFICVGILVICDFCLGVAKANKLGNFNSRRAIDKFYDSVAYFIGIIICHIVELTFGDAVPIVKAVTAVIAVAEVQSVREKIKDITGKDILKPLVDMLKQRSGQRDSENEESNNKQRDV